MGWSSLLLAAPQEMKKLAMKVLAVKIRERQALAAVSLGKWAYTLGNSMISIGMAAAVVF